MLLEGPSKERDGRGAKIEKEMSESKGGKRVSLESRKELFVQSVDPTRHQRTT